MHSYLTTLAFLALMSLVTASESVRFFQNSLEHKCYSKAHLELASLEKEQNAGHLRTFHKKYEKDLVEELEPVVPPTKPAKLPSSPSKIEHPRPLKVKFNRPPNNSRLNLYFLLHKDPYERCEEIFSLYQALARLMRCLYEKEPFFSSGVEYLILDALIEKKEQTLHFKTVDEFATLSLGEPQVQAAFYNMLIGTKQAPSLLHYITFDVIEGSRVQNRKINLLFADPLILEVVFAAHHQAVVAKLIEAREKMCEEIREQEEKRLEMRKEEGHQRTEIAKALQVLLDVILEEAGLKSGAYATYIFDCTLGSPGDILFMPDPLTGKRMRKHYRPLQMN